MKLQVDRQSLRIRIDESELAQLFDGHTVSSLTHFAKAFEVRFELRLVDASEAQLSGRADHWRIDVPEAAARELASRLPTRQGLRFELPTAGVEPTELLFDVDVRDSARRRRGVDEATPR